MTNGVGYFGLILHVLEVTDNSNNANDIAILFSCYLIGGISKQHSLIDDKIYYPVKRADLRNSNLIHNRK